MTDTAEVLEVVRGLLNTVGMGQVEFHEMLVERTLQYEGVQAEDENVITLAIGVEYMQSESEPRCAIRASVEASDEDVHVRVMAGAQWTLPNQDALSDPEVRDAFVTRVAIPALYPYIRVKVQELTAATGGKVIVLGIVDPRRFMEVAAKHSDADRDETTTRSD